MELYKLTQAFTELLEIEDVKKSPERLMEIIQKGYEGFFDSLTALHDDLTTDHLQPIFQYYMADRKEKMQDYTPSCLGRLIAKLNHIENANSCKSGKMAPKFDAKMKFEHKKKP